MLVPLTPGRRSLTPASAVDIEPEASNWVTEAAVYSPPTTTGSPSAALTGVARPTAAATVAATPPKPPKRIARLVRGMLESIAIADHPPSLRARVRCRRLSVLRQSRLDVK